MNKVRISMDSQKEVLKNLFYNYSVTLICVALISILCCFDANYGGPKDILFDTFYFLFNFSIGAIFIETFVVDENGKKPTKKLTGSLIADGIISLGWTMFYYYSSEISEALEGAEVSYQLLKFIILKFWYVYLISLIALTIYKLIKKSKLDMDIYIGRVLFGVLMVLAVAMILILATESILVMFDSLIMEISYWDYFYKGNILVFGFVIFPYILKKLTDTKQDVSTFTKGFVAYVLMTCVVLAIALVYIHIFKLMLCGDYPSNEVFNICIKLFVIGGPIWFISYGFIRTRVEESRQPLSIYGRIVKNIKYAYIPLIILEIIAVVIRISNYGLTEERYLGVVVIVFQIIYVMWDIIGKILKRNIKYENLILVGLVLLIITFVAPFINYSRLSYLSQKNRFEKAMELEKYGVAEGAFQYLMFNNYGEDYIRKNYTTEERNHLFSVFNERETNIEEYYYKRVRMEISPKERELGINVKGYTRSVPFNYKSKDTEVFSHKDLENISIHYRGDNSPIKNVNIKPIVDNSIKIIDDDSENLLFTGTLYDYEYMEIDENCCVVVENIYFEYNKETKEVRYLEIDGCVLLNEENQ